MWLKINLPLDWFISYQYLCQGLSVLKKNNPMTDTVRNEPISTDAKYHFKSKIKFNNKTS